jgi:2-C-methyl-D-erythritol 4-phosphate cytidylyltransferase
VETRIALIVAGGKGQRMGGETPKQFIEIAGRPILAHTVDAFLSFDPQLKIVVVLHPSLTLEWTSRIPSLFSAETQTRLFTCAGGDERVHSVHNGLRFITSQSLAGENPLVAIHDGVRPFITHPVLQSAYTTASSTGNAVVAVAVKSSMRMKTENGASVAVDRAQFFHVQTPQVFRLRDILTGYDQRTHDSFTDDASLAETAGMEIHLVTGTYENIKITTPEDLAVAQYLLEHQGN